MVTVYFPKYLRSLTNGVAQHSFEVEDYQNLIEGLRILFPDLSMYLSQIDSGHITNVCFFLSKEKEEVIKPSVSRKIKDSELVLIITLYGQGDDTTNILIGVALVAASFIPGLQGVTIPLLGVTLSGLLSSVGLNLVLSGFAGLLRPDATSAPTASTDAAVRAQNDAFGSLQNTTSTDTAIPLIFGHMRVPGQFIGGRIKTINHDAYTTVSVANYV
jgi:predicted phage tail protein